MWYDHKKKRPRKTSGLFWSEWRSLGIGTCKNSKALTKAIPPLSLITLTMVTKFHSPAIPHFAVPVSSSQNGPKFWQKCE